MIAYKIDNCDRQEYKDYLNEIKNEIEDKLYYLEFGLECYDPRHTNLESSLLPLIKDIKNKKICHLSLNNRLFQADNKEQWLLNINKELAISKELNGLHNILHATNKDSKNMYLKDKKEMFKIMRENSILLKEKNILIENTYEDLDFQEELFSHLDKSIGFVLDIGHVKVHSKYKHKDWINFVAQLEREGRHLHFHIHDNDGSFDQHNLLTFAPTQQSKFFIDLYERFCGNYVFTFEQHGIHDFQAVKQTINRYEDTFSRRGFY